MQEPTNQPAAEAMPTEPTIKSVDPPRKNEIKKNRERTRSIISTLLLLIFAPILALAINMFVFQSYQVEGPSMQNNLAWGDRLIVLKIERTWAKITGKPFIPKRGTVVVFKKPGLDTHVDGSTEQKQLIKRVVGLPGERVVVKDGKLTVYNAQNPDGFNPDAGQPYEAKLTTPTPGNVDVIVGENEVFICGDNRPNSLDSRSLGTIKAENIVGVYGARILHGKKSS